MNYFSAIFYSFLIDYTYFVLSVLPQNDTKNKRGTRKFAQQLIIKELNFLKMFG